MLSSPHKVLGSPDSSDKQTKTHTFSSRTMNEELINSAVSFLRDPGVATSPLNKKIEFLLSKGLNEQEIEEAMKRANKEGQNQPETSAPMTYQSTINALNGQQIVQPPLPYDYYAVAPQVPERSWKDYFIMATATAGVTYGLYQVFSRYLLPSIIPPGQSRVDEDKEKIDEEFIKIDKVLEQMALEQKEIKDANEAKLKDIDDVIANVNDFLSRYNKDKIKFDDDLRLMKLEVDSLQNTIEKSLKLTKENIHSELEDIVDELTSLKSLIKARNGSSTGAERKVVPVSSIPSASEILKKVKSNAAKSPKSSPASTVNNTTPGMDSKSDVGHKGPVQSSEEVPSVGITAAGIPDWQLAHKKQEEEMESKPATSWQQSSTQNLEADEKVVEESILKVGVPAWQLAAGN